MVSIRWYLGSLKGQLGGAGICTDIDVQILKGLKDPQEGLGSEYYLIEIMLACAVGSVVWLVWSLRMIAKTFPE